MNFNNFKFYDIDVTNFYNILFIGLFMCNITYLIVLARNIIQKI
jgi:hypothetical protein